MLAKRIDPTANSGDMLTKIQVQSFYKGGIDLPTPLGQDRLDGLRRPKDDTVFDPDDTPTPVGFDKA